MLTLYTFFPLLVVSLASFVITADFDQLPLWFLASSLPLGYNIQFALYTLVLVWIFFKFERAIAYAGDESAVILRRAFSVTLVSIGFLIFSFVTGVEINIRDLSQEYSLNIAYNIIRVLIVFFYFGRLGESWGGGVILSFVVGFFNAFSGSKASMLIPILIVLMVNGRINLKFGIIVSAVALAGFVGLIPTHYFVRYLDPGLSAYQTVYIYVETGKALMDYHLATIANALSGVRGYNPVVEYLNDTGLAAGYNLTPTIVGEMMGSGSVVGLLLLASITAYLSLAKRLWLDRGTLGKSYFSVSFFVMLGVMQSSLLDIFFYIIYFFIALGLVKVLSPSLNRSPLLNRARA